MDNDFFQAQMSRLAQNFGASHYKTDRMALIWSEVSTLPNGSFKRIVDRLIGDCRQAPLLSDMREEISREREKQRELDRREERNSFQRVWNTKVTIEGHDQKMIVRTIIKRIQGKVPDNDWVAFMKLLNQWSL